MPTRAEVTERLSALKRKIAIPGWVAVGVGILNWWDLLDFLWAKADLYGVDELLASPGWMLVVAVVWLSAAVFRPGARVRTPYDVHFDQLRNLVAEASDRLLAEPRGPIKTFDEGGERTWPYLRTTLFVERAFSHRVAADFDAYVKAEVDKTTAVGQYGDLSHICGTYLKNLSHRLTHEDVDFGFVLPGDWDHFLNGVEWPPNRRPAQPFSRC